MNLLKPAVQDELRSLPGVESLTSLPRCATLYTQSQPADALFLITNGLVKLTRMNEAGAKIILAICGPGQLVGEEALAEDPEVYYTESVVLTPATIYRIPRTVILNTLKENVQLGSTLVSYILSRKLELALKVELLCLHDVEYRILHYLAQLSSLMPPTENGDGYRIPITQLELADLIGATRETTSTTLNQLERRGLLKLSRRLLTLPSPEVLMQAANARVTSAAAGPTSSES